MPARKLLDFNMGRKLEREAGADHYPVDRYTVVLHLAETIWPSRTHLTGRSQEGTLYLCLRTRESVRIESVAASRWEIQFHVRPRACTHAGRVAQRPVG